MFSGPGLSILRNTQKKITRLIQSRTVDCKTTIFNIIMADEQPKQERRGVKRARKQADEIETPIEVLNGGMYNIWYNKVVGDYTTWRERRDQK